eukprot:275538_1
MKLVSLLALLGFICINESTPRPTPKPTPKPTPRPTDPGTSTCGDILQGSYHGTPVTFTIQMPFVGDLEFSAAGSNFRVTDIEAFTKLNVPLGTDVDKDEVVTIHAVPEGQYKFIIHGEGTQSGTFQITSRCTSADPTRFPTVKPTIPTPKPTPIPTKRPTPVTN